jgi:citrate synthase
MEPWRTAITTSDEKNIFIRGHNVMSLMTQATFTDAIFLLHQSRLPTKEERRLFDAILIGVSDHGPAAPSAAAARMVASGNRQSLEAAIAAGVLAIGDAHGGSGSACMASAKSEHARLPGMGHRVHTEDPRTRVLFDMAKDFGLAGEGVAFMRALEAAVSEQMHPLPINIDGALAAILFDLGFSPPIAKLLFIIGRVTGLTAQVMEEYTREKPMRIRIPVNYDGAPPRGDA